MPSKKKKQKTRHGETGRGDLSQAEIWDDSSLIRSWNDALAEYEYYHSIHARGEDVEEILRKAELGDLGDEDDPVSEKQSNGGCQPTQNGAGTKPKVAESNGYSYPGGATKPLAIDGAEEGEEDDDDDEEGEIQEEPEELSLEERRKAAMQQLANQSDTVAEQPLEEDPSAMTAAPMIGPSLPPSVEAGADAGVKTQPGPAPSQDQTLENIKMAYYWAGYYSGLYDGQRQVQNQAQP